jgi:transposase-like protein
MSETRRKFDPEFKEGAVRIVRETGQPIAQIARDLGVHEGTLDNWVAKDRAEREGTHGLSTGDAAELKRLRAENAQLRMGRDVLKRSVVLCGSVVLCEGDDEVSVARFIADQRTMHRVPHAVTCAILGVSISWFCKWLHREPTDRERRRAELDTRVRELFVASKRTYGSPRIHADLLDEGWKVSVNTFAESMCRQGLHGRKPKRSKGLTRQD